MIEMENKWQEGKKDRKKPPVPLKITSRRQSAPSTFGEPEHLRDTLSWPTEDIEKLLSRMKQHIPPSDHLRHQSRALHLPWDLIAFNEYTSLECQQMWKLVLQRVRGFRILQEVLSDAEEWLKQPWTDFYASKLKNRHPDRPKKPLSSYMLYYKDQIKIIRKEFPKLSITGIAKIASEKFANMKAKEKAKYTKRSKLAKEEYDRNLEIFLAEHPSEISKSQKTKKQQRQTKKITAFNLYMEDQLQKASEDKDFEEKPFKELYSFYRHQWEELYEEEKLPWLHWAEQKQQDIQQISNSDKIVPPVKSVLTKKEQQICERANGKPSKPPTNVYTLFTRMMLLSGELSEYQSKDRMREVSLRWQSIGSEERLALEKQLREEKMQYAMDLEDYLKYNPIASSVEEKPQKIKKRKKTKDNEIKEEENLSDKDFKEAAYSGNKKKGSKLKRGRTAEEDFGISNVNGHIPERVDHENKNNKINYSEEEIYAQPDSVINAELSPKKKKKKGNNIIPVEEAETSYSVVSKDEILAKKKKKHLRFEELSLEETDSFTPTDTTKKGTKRNRKSEPTIAEEEQSTNSKEESPAKKKKKHQHEEELSLEKADSFTKKKINDKILSKNDQHEILNSFTTETTLVNFKKLKPPPKLPVKFFAKAMKKQKIKYASDEDLEEAWKNLPSSERKFYKKTLKEAKKTYLVNFETYLNSLSPKSLKNISKQSNAAGKKK